MMPEELLKRLKAIGNETRLAILYLLAKNGTMCACKILSNLNITQGTLSHHMKLLVEADFVTCEEKGKWCYYSLNEKTLLAVSAQLTDLSKQALSHTSTHCSICQ